MKYIYINTKIMPWNYSSNQSNFLSPQKIRLGDVKLIWDKWDDPVIQ